MDVPETLFSPCCTWRRAYIQSEVLPLIEKVAKSAKARFGWKYTLRAIPPYWQLYISEDDLTKEELEQMKQQEGPTKILQEMMERG